jgi:TPR repeat protein
MVHNDAEAVRWYRRAAELGHARAWNKLGWMLESGDGCRANGSSAVEAYREAALLGSHKAMCHMAALHRDARCGLPVNLSEAKMWFAAAARAGSSLARDQLLLLGVSDWRSVQRQVISAGSQAEELAKMK